MKKSQINSQVFVYILGIVVVAILLVFGYNLIKKVSINIDKEQHAQFKAELTRDIDTVANKYGTLKKASYELGANTRLCIIDLSKNNEILNTVSINEYPLIKDSIEADTGKNVFFYEENSITDSFTIDSVKIDHYPYYLCFEEEAEIGIKGLGNAALLTADFVSKAKPSQDKDVTFSSFDGSLTVTIPKGSVASQEEISVEVVAHSAPNQASDGYDFQPVCTTFNPKLKLELTYLPDLVGDDCPDELTFVYEYDCPGTGETATDTYQASLSDGTINCESHTATFYLTRI